MKKILITGANSYIGTSVEKYLSQWPDDYQVDTLDMVGEGWKQYSFTGYDSVFHVAGIAHSDSGKITAEKSEQYYRINTDLAIETGKKAKQEKVKQFIFMSSIIVYGNSAALGEDKIITFETEPSPSNSYGDSKLQAEQGLRTLQNDDFSVCILRPPMIYGKGCKGNYPLLAKLAMKTPIFPNYPNQRSMLYIENFCEFIRLVIDDKANGLFFPQNSDYVHTSALVYQIAEVHGKHIKYRKIGCGLTKVLVSKSELISKIFGTLRYEQNMSFYEKKYQIIDFNESIKRTEL